MNLDKLIKMKNYSVKPLLRLGKNKTKNPNGTAWLSSTTSRATLEKSNQTSNQVLESSTLRSTNFSSPKEE